MSDTTIPPNDLTAGTPVPETTTAPTTGEPPTVTINVPVAPVVSLKALPGGDQHTDPMIAAMTTMQDMLQQQVQSTAEANEIAKIADLMDIAVKAQKLADLVKGKNAEVAQQLLTIVEMTVGVVHDTLLDEGDEEDEAG